ncbi:MAG: DUF1080 domain-containing protein [Planctomycetaceae bacterium]
MQPSPISVNDQAGSAGRNTFLLMVVVLTIIVPCGLLFSNIPEPAEDLLFHPSANRDEEIFIDYEYFFQAAADKGGTPSGMDELLATAAAVTDDVEESPIEARRPFDPPPGVSWQSLFNGKNLEGWTITNFGGEGPVEIEDGALMLTLGQSLTGVTLDKKVEIPTINYEVQLSAMRATGRDFFCGLTFPVKKDPCSLILGGWGGGVCGLSSIDFLDAHENETTSYREFETGRWYHIRLRVQEHRIEAWIDHERIIKQRIVGRKISIRPEVHLSVPFGLASYETTAAIKNLRIRPLAPSEIAVEENR